MVTFTAKIIDPIGLHARPASVTVSAASNFDSKIMVSSKDKIGNLKSKMNIMALGIKQGDEITITATGIDEEEAIAEIKNIMKKSSLI